jgi:uncharacterized protein (TIGR03435 family)
LPVVDQTGLKAAYDFHLDVGMPSPGVAESTARKGRRWFQRTLDRRSSLHRLEQIGLKPESREVPIQVIVIDHVEPPK